MRKCSRGGLYRSEPEVSRLGGVAVSPSPAGSNYSSVVGWLEGCVAPVYRFKRLHLFAHLFHLPDSAKRLLSSFGSSSSARTEEGRKFWQKVN